MRRCSLLITLGLLLISLLGMQFAASQAPATMEASVDIHPEVFNLKRNGTGTHGVITVRVSDLTKEGTSYNVTEIDVLTIVLYHEAAFVAQPLRTEVAGDHLIVKFDATTVANYIWFKLWHMGITPPAPPPDYTMTFTVKGELFNGEEFAGSDTIKVVFP